MFQYLFPIFMMQITEKLREVDIYALLFILFLSFVVENCMQHYNLSFKMILQFWNRRFNYNISFYGMRAYDKYGCKYDKYSLNATPGFLALNSFLINHLRDGNMMNSHTIKEITYQDVEKDKSNQLWFQLESNSIVHLKDCSDWKHVYFAMRESPITRGEKSYGMEDMTKVELKVMSNVHDVSSIMKRCDVLFKKFEDEKQGRTSNTLFLCRYIGVSKGSNKLSFDILPFETNCSMDNLFFEEKEKVMNYIDFFEKNKHWYQKRGRPYTLGICTHGPPGCGKTSFEKALSVFLKRHLIIVDFEKVKSEEELQALFFSEYIGPYRIPNEKRLYVFPDIDKTTDILYRPEFQSSKNENSLSSSNTVEKILLNKIQNNTDVSEKISDNEMNNQTRIINLSQILNIFDGLLERTGQIFIMSANHPEKLDPAIVRPGRVDCTIHFKEFSTTLLETFINSFFQKEEFISHSFFKTYHNELDFRFCPSKLFELCVECNENQFLLQKLLLKSERTTSES